MPSLFPASVEAVPSVDGGSCEVLGSDVDADAAWAAWSSASAAASSSESASLKYFVISNIASSSGFPLFLKLSRKRELPDVTPTCASVFCKSRNDPSSLFMRDSVGIS